MWPILYGRRLVKIWRKSEVLRSYRLLTKDPDDRGERRARERGNTLKKPGDISLDVFRQRPLIATDLPTQIETLYDNNYGSWHAVFDAVVSWLSLTYERYGADTPAQGLRKQFSGAFTWTKSVSCTFHGNSARFSACCGNLTTH